MDNVDFLGLNDYSRLRVLFAPGGCNEYTVWQTAPLEETMVRSDATQDVTFDEIYPAGMGRALRRLAGCGRPIYSKISRQGAKFAKKKRKRLLPFVVLAPSRASFGG